MSTRFFRAIPTVLLTLLVACSGPAPQTQKPSDGPLSESALESQVRDLVQSAREAPASQRPDYILQAAELLLKENQPEWALNLLQSLDTARLSDPVFMRYSKDASEAALAAGEYFDAHDILFASRLAALWPQLPPGEQSLILERRAQVESLLGDYQQSLNTRIQLGQFLSRDQLQLNNEAIWQDLMSLTGEDLQSLANQTDDRELQGWAQLAQISRDNTANLNRQLERVELWQMRWPYHPASLELPSDLQLLNQLIAQQPRKIAMLLPQTGRLAGAATAVRDGFLAAYLSQETNGQRPEILQYDTSSADINQLYDQAVADGAQIIIGPLAKENVDILATRAQLAVPILALNYSDGEAAQPTPATQQNPAMLSPISKPINLPPIEPAAPGNSLFTPQLYQFGLAPEDEARDIARFAHLQGYRRVMIIAPDIDWASRSIDAFAEQWIALGGSIVTDTRYIGAGDYSDVIKRSLLIGQSEERHRQLRQIIYTNSEFEPRRRKDVDVIFMIANPTQARQIKPTLAFHYAGDLPVLATSQIYDGSTDAKGDRDLNGIRFNTLPWFFSASPETKAIQQFAEGPAAYQRLYAMGADAYHLYPRLPQLQQLPQTRLLGATGALTLNKSGKIVREPIWAEFDNGIAKPLSTRPLERDE
ncbi:penicillin-binding protein activator [Gilvimarinus sp. DA14]|uniref:penicillin-binding protein activator n=1 Tax=Gilvimarinus sp. DA14 TaxID=2956798 RepID=UPI0020B79C41|nr:penicillin-binding protein activator [Gilvimarinus sp. DA14]UTF59637.1 penicillin-binding protein activator [Gilvimarinus sp. DA14]